MFATAEHLASINGMALRGDEMGTVGLEDAKRSDQFRLHAASERP